MSVALLLLVAVLAWPVRRGARATGLAPGRGPRARRGGSATGADGGQAGRRRLALDPRGSRGRADGEREVLVVLEALVPALSAGLPVAAALEAVPGSGLATLLGRSARDGAPLGPVWEAWARATGASGATTVARVWRLGDRLGSPLADGLADAAAALRAQGDRSRRIAGAVAGPVATARLLTLLPLVGPLLALASGLGVEELFGGARWVSAVVGALLVAVGHGWCRALLRAPTRPRPVGSL